MLARRGTSRPERSTIKGSRARDGLVGYRGRIVGRGSVVQDSLPSVDGRGHSPVRSSYKTIGLWVILIILFVAFYQFFSNTGKEVQELTFTSLQHKVEEHKVKSLQIKGTEYGGTFTDSNTEFRATGPAPDVALLEKLSGQGVDVKIL